jgi:hypothetical protein
VEDDRIRALFDELHDELTTTPLPEQAGIVAAGKGL